MGQARALSEPGNQEGAGWGTEVKLRCNEDGRGAVVGGAKRNPGVSTEHGHGSSRCCLARRQVSRQALSADGVRCTEQGVSLPVSLAQSSLPVRTRAWLSSRGRLCTLSKELKWCTSWCSPYIPFWCCKQGETTRLDDVCQPGPQTSPAVQQVCVHGKQVPGSGERVGQWEWGDCQVL